MRATGLPGDVENFMDFIGTNIQASGNFVYNERDRIKSDMMLVRHRWAPSRVPVDAFHAKCISVGMSPDEADQVADWLRKAQAGRRLVPQYDKTFRWHEDPTP